MLTLGQILVIVTFYYLWLAVVIIFLLLLIVSFNLTKEFNSKFHLISKKSEFYSTLHQGIHYSILIYWSEGGGKDKIDKIIENIFTNTNKLDSLNKVTGYKGRIHRERYYKISLSFNTRSSPFSV